ncbi:MAG TPA: hypothetical protein VD862_00105 [Candidatus Paceibacterota bacterium]|nr:hypothetical protein [Candidatus Paceibacterota bacterium]
MSRVIRWHVMRFDERMNPVFQLCRASREGAYAEKSRLEAGHPPSTFWVEIASNCAHAALLA